MTKDRFDAVVSPVDIVAHKKVICVRGLAPNAEQLHKVVELTVHVAAHSHRAFDLSDGRQNCQKCEIFFDFHLLDIALLAQDLLRLFTERFHLRISLLGFTRGHGN